MESASSGAENRRECHPGEAAAVLLVKKPDDGTAQAA